MKRKKEESKAKIDGGRSAVWGEESKDKEKEEEIERKKEKKETRREEGKRKKKAKWKQESWHLLSCLQINIYITGVDLKNKNWLIFESYHMKDIFHVRNFVNIHRCFKFIEWKTFF